MSRSPSKEKEAIDDARKVFVTNIDVQFELRKLFDPFGSITKLNVKKNKNGHYSFGFIEFQQGECANKAIKELDQYELFGKRMRVRQDRQNEGCFHCKKSGHFARECPENKEGRQVRQYNNQRYNNNRENRERYERPRDRSRDRGYGDRYQGERDRDRDRLYRDRDRHEHQYRRRRSPSRSRSYSRQRRYRRDYSSQSRSRSYERRYGHPTHSRRYHERDNRDRERHREDLRRRRSYSRSRSRSSGR